MNETAVYVAAIPNTDVIGEVYPPERQADIDRCSNPKVKKEKYFVWKLLEYVIADNFGEKIENISFEKQQNGKWVADKFFFSLSHSDSVVAVAVSGKSVGVDVETIRKHRDGLESYILTEQEMAELCRLDRADSWEYIIKLWTQKESIFKTLDRKTFEPTKIETLNYPVRTEKIELPTGKYMLSVCAECVDDVPFKVYNF